MSVILVEVNLRKDIHSLDEFLNSPTPFDYEPSHSDISNLFLKNLFDSRQQSAESTANNIQESEDNASLPSVLHVTQSLSEIPDKSDYFQSRRGLDAVLSHVSYFKARHIEESDNA